MTKLKMVTKGSRNSGVSVRKQVLSVLNSRVEHKHFVKINAYGATSSTGGTTSLSTGIILGDGATQRDGIQIVPESLRFRWSAFNGATNVLAKARMIVFQDRQANGVLATVTDVLDTAVIDSMYNPTVVSEQKRIRILYDHTFDLGILTGGGHANATHDVKLKPSGPITFLAATDVVGACGKNVINILIIGDTANTVQYSVSWDIGYTDS